MSVLVRIVEFLEFVSYVSFSGIVNILDRIYLYCSGKFAVIVSFVETDCNFLLCYYSVGHRSTLHFHNNNDFYVCICKLNTNN